VLRAGTRIVSVPDQLSNTVAAPANCALATMVHAFSRLPASCKSLVIQGAGMLGLYGCALARERGIDPIFCVDAVEQRRRYATLFGAFPIDAQKASYEEKYEELLKIAPRGVDAVIEVLGASDLVPEGIRLLRPGGHYIFAGMVHPDSELSITGEQVIRKCLTIHGVHNYSMEDIEKAVSFLSETETRYPYAALVGRTFPLSQLDAAFDEARAQRWVRVGVNPTLE